MNEYLKTDGALNWPTRIARHTFPSCVSAANAYGIVTGTITLAETGAPISGVRMALSNDFAGASDANGIYTVLVSVAGGPYTATADPDRNCTSAAPAPATVAPTAWELRLGGRPDGPAPRVMSMPTCGSMAVIRW